MMRQLFQFYSRYRCVIFPSFTHLMKRSFAVFSFDMNPPVVRPLAPLKLSENESKLRDLLIDLTTSLTSSRTPDNEPLELRWAGGWVRDKLLGIASNDIDIAINCMTGEAFGLELGSFCEQEWVMEKYAIEKEDLHGLHLIRLNPEKSKNLETATTQLFGVDLDFVNLRKETYAQDSRNPEIEFGTACEDAMRRDATVNALFYNIHTDCIEDFTNGLADIEAKRIRTPLDPLQTFMDDPLRVLRLVRFSSRLGFKIDKDSRRCMQEPQVLNALALKITRERIGIELVKMLKGHDPRAALVLISELNLYHTIFTNVSKLDLAKPDISNWPSVYNLMYSISHDTEDGSLYRYIVTNDSEAYFAWALVCLCPWEYVPEPVQEGPKTKANSIPQIITIAREGFRATNKLCDVLLGCHKNLYEIRQFKEAIIERDEWIQERGRVAMMLRRWEGNATHWRLQLLYAMFTDALKVAPHEDEKLRSLEITWKKVFEWISELNLMDAHLEKSLIDGHSLSKVLGVKPGKWLGGALDVCLEWQFNNPGVTDTTEAIEEVRKRSFELDIKQ